MAGRNSTRDVARDKPDPDMKNRFPGFATRMLMCLAPALPAAAADIDSTGTQPFNQNWSTASIWSDNATPSAGNDYFILDGHLVRTPEASGAFAFPGDSLTINSGGTLALKNRETITVNLISAGGKISHFGTGTTPDTSRIGGTILLNNNLTIEPASAEQSGRTIEISADISGSGTLIKTGANLLTLSGNNSFGSGTMTFGSSSTDRGYIRLAHNNALGNVSTIALASSQGGVSGLQLEGGVTISQALTTQGRSNATTTGYILRNVSGNNTWNGSVTITAGGGGYGFLSDAGGMLTLAGTVTSTFSSTTLGARSLTFIGDGDFLVSGDIVRGGTQNSQDLNLTKDGSGTLTLSGENDYTGNTNVNAGTLVAGSSGALADTAAVAVNNAGTTLRVNFGGTGEYADAGLSTLLAKTSFNNSATNFAIDTSNAAGDAGFTGVLDMGASFAKSGTGTLVLSGAHSYTGGTTLSGGTLRLSGDDDRLPTGTTLAFTGSSTLDVTDTSQTLAGITTPDGANVNLAVTGSGGALVINAGADFEIGPGGASTSAHAVALDLSGLSDFTWTNASGDFRVGFKTGATNSGGIGEIATATLAGSNTITANLLAVGDRAGSNDGGISALRLGQSNTLHLGSLNVGYSGRSDASLSFATGLTNPSVTIRDTDGSSAMPDWRVGNVSNFNGAAQTTWAADIDFSAGSIDAKVVNLLVGASDIGNGTNRGGSQNSSFTMGAGSMEVATLTIGRISGSGSSTIGGTMAANGTFTLDDAGGILKAGTVILAENTTLAGGAGARSVSGTFRLLDGTLEATTIQRGAQSGNATATTTFEWSGGTIRNTSGQDLGIDTVPITLTGGGTRVFEATSGQSITVGAASPVSGGGGITLAGSGTVRFDSANTYTGATSVNAGTLELGTSASLDSPVTIGTAGTLSGGGTINASTTIQGTHAPGFSPGLQTFTDGLVYASGSVLVWDFVGNTLGLRGSDFDGIDVTGGNLSIDPLATLALVATGVDYSQPEWSFNAGTRQFKVIDFSGTGSSDDSFQLLDTSAAGSFASFGSWSTFNDNGDIIAQWSPIPEPSAASLAALAALAALTRRRRRKD